MSFENGMFARICLCRVKPVSDVWVSLCWKQRSTTCTLVWGVLCGWSAHISFIVVKTCDLQQQADDDDICCQWRRERRRRWTTLRTWDYAVRCWVVRNRHCYQNWESLMLEWLITDNRWRTLTHSSSEFNNRLMTSLPRMLITLSVCMCLSVCLSVCLCLSVHQSHLLCAAWTIYTNTLSKLTLSSFWGR